RRGRRARRALPRARSHRGGDDDPRRRREALGDSLGAWSQAGDALRGLVGRGRVHGFRAARRNFALARAAHRGGGYALAGRSAMKPRAAVRDPLIAEIGSARQLLLSVLPPEEIWARQPVPSYSPISWHLGHIAATQERWLLPCEPSRYGSAFDPMATPKPVRV